MLACMRLKPLVTNLSAWSATCISIGGGRCIVMQSFNIGYIEYNFFYTCTTRMLRMLIWQWQYIFDTLYCAARVSRPFHFGKVASGRLRLWQLVLMKCLDPNANIIIDTNVCIVIGLDSVSSKSGHVRANTTPFTSCTYSVRVVFLQCFCCILLFR